MDYSNEQLRALAREFCPAGSARKMFSSIVSSS